MPKVSKTSRQKGGVGGGGEWEERRYREEGQGVEGLICQCNDFDFDLKSDGKQLLQYSWPLTVYLKILASDPFKTKVRSHHSSLKTLRWW